MRMVWLNRLRNEIEQHENEENLWNIEGLIVNSAGNLCLHLVGNLNTYIGKEIGNINYVRNRELEFSVKDVSRKELLDKINYTIEVVNRSPNNVDESSLSNEYPVLVFDQKTSTEYLLVHLATHLTYHLGQINYHRRLMDK
jgi:uncharacterized damage-inducible protein DinB